MKPVQKIIAIALLLLASTALTQEIVLTTPEARPSATRLRLGKVEIDFPRDQAIIPIHVMTAAGESVRYFNLVVPDPARASTFRELLAAMGTIRAGESGNAENRSNFRILGYLRDKGYPEVLVGTLQ